MDIWQLIDISEQNLALVNPIAPQKVIEAGQAAGLNQDSRVIEFGAGYGEILKIWGKAFGISGLGVEIRETACQRAKTSLAGAGVQNQISIVCADADVVTIWL